MNVIDHFKDYEFAPETGRAGWFGLHYMISKQYNIENKEWPLNIAVVAVFKDHLIKWYYILKDGNKEIYPLLELFKKDKNKLDKLEKAITKIRDETRILLEKTQSNSSQQLRQTILEFYSNYSFLTRMASILRMMDRVIVENIRKIYKDKENVDQIIQKLAVSDEVSFVTKEELAILNLAKKIKERKEKGNSAFAKKELEEIYLSYNWLTAGYYTEETRTLDDYERLLNEALEKSPEQRYNNIIQQHTKEKQERDAIIQKLSPEEREIAIMAGKMVHLKDYYKFSANEIIVLSQPLFARIAERTNKPLSYIKDLIPEEVADLLEEKKLDEEMIAARTKQSAFIVNPEILKVLTGKEAQKFEDQYLSITGNNEKTFKGRAASPGRAQGSAKIVLSPTDFNKLQKGDILVVTNTSPDFVTIMKKAAAIIAEEGAITAHVSVVSREFGIPCVVGVKNATQIFKDNENIEVDANKGIIRRL